MIDYLNRLRDELDLEENQCRLGRVDLARRSNNASYETLFGRYSYPNSNKSFFNALLGILQRGTGNFFQLNKPEDKA